MVAKTLYGLEELLAAELSALGAAEINLGKRAVSFSGDRRLLYKANLRCRLATRILVPIREFHAATAGELYHHVSQVHWSRYLDLNKTFAVDAVTHFSEFNNSMFVAQKVKDAVVDWFRRQSGQRPNVDPITPDVRLHIHLRGKKATLALDASGEPLSHRGYRLEGGEAPVNEVLAAGIITLSGWDCLSPFVDGMCGSGTLAIEAALMARNIAPGLLRKEFAFMRWPDFNRRLWQEVFEEARQAASPTAPAHIFAIDIEPARVREALANARRAGVTADLSIAAADFAAFDPPPGPGVLVVNPPYGERLMPGPIGELYKRIGDTFKSKYEGYKAHILTGNIPAIKQIGLRSSRRITLYNGPLECRLLVYDMYKGSRRTPPDGKIGE